MDESRSPGRMRNERVLSPGRWQQNRKTKSVPPRQNPNLFQADPEICNSRERNIRNKI